MRDTGCLWRRYLTLFILHGTVSYVKSFFQIFRLFFNDFYKANRPESAFAPPCETSVLLSA